MNAPAQRYNNSKSYYDKPKLPAINQTDLENLSKRYSAYSIERLDALIKTIIVKEVTIAEVEAFLYIAEQLGLCPFKKQIQLLDFKGSKRAYTTIDGFRVIAEKSQEYVGQTIPLFCGKDKQWTEVWTEDEPPFAAKVGIYRKGFVEPIFAIAKWNSYSSDSFTWNKMPDTMLAKCAESLALRKAFPNNMNGLHTVEEMEKAFNETIEVTHTKEEPKQILENKPAAKVEVKEEAAQVKAPVNNSVPAQVAKSQKVFEKKEKAIEAEVIDDGLYNSCDEHKVIFKALMKELESIKAMPRRNLEEIEIVTKTYHAYNNRCIGVPLKNLKEHLINLEKDFISEKKNESTAA